MGEWHCQTNFGNTVFYLDRRSLGLGSSRPPYTAVLPTSISPFIVHTIHAVQASKSFGFQPSNSLMTHCGYKRRAVVTLVLGYSLHPFYLFLPTGNSFHACPVCKLVLSTRETCQPAVISCTTVVLFTACFENTSSKTLMNMKQNIKYWFTHRTFQNLKPYNIVALNNINELQHTLQQKLLRLYTSRCWRAIS